MSSLDVSIQATIINLLMDIQRKKNLAYLFVYHDLSVVPAHLQPHRRDVFGADRGNCRDRGVVCQRPAPLYPGAALRRAPHLTWATKSPESWLKGDVPSPVDPPDNCCRFAPRCWMASERCSKEAPQMQDVDGKGHFVACHFCQESRARAQNAEKSTD